MRGQIFWPIFFSFWFKKSRFNYEWEYEQLFLKNGSVRLPIIIIPNYDCIIVSEFLVIKHSATYFVSQFGDHHFTSDLFIIQRKHQMHMDNTYEILEYISSSSLLTLLKRQLNGYSYRLPPSRY